MDGYLQASPWNPAEAEGDYRERFFGVGSGEGSQKLRCGRLREKTLYQRETGDGCKERASVLLQ